MDWFQIGKGVPQGCILTSSLFNLYAAYIMWKVRLDCQEILNWIDSIQLIESRLQGEISITSYIQMITPLWQKAQSNKRASWWKWEESEKAALQLNIQKTKIMASSPSLHGKEMGKQWKQWQTLFPLVPKSLQMVMRVMELKDTCSLEEKLWPT